MKAIAAMCENRVIGMHGQIPWKNKLDMRFFKAMTWGHEVIVGRTTYEKMGPLENRFHYVLSDSKRGNYTEGTEKPVSEFLTFDQLTKKKDLDDAWVIGGAKVYQKLLPLCSDLYMTFIIESHDGDTYMPMFENLFNEQRTVYEGKDMWIVHYWNHDDEPFSYQEEYREGFDANLMGVSIDDNPYTPSGHERDTTYEDEQHYHWYSGHCDAPTVKGLNDRV